MATICTEASAPGKLILFGEHAVVYGALAIAGALSDLRISVRVVRCVPGRTVGRELANTRPYTMLATTAPPSLACRR